MKTKSFKEYLEKRLDKEEIAAIKKQAQLEVRILRSLQGLISDTMNEIGFNELVRRAHRKWQKFSEEKQI